MGFFQRVASIFRARPPLALPAPASSSTAQSLAEQFAAAVGGWTIPKRGTWELLTAYAELPWLHAVVRRRAEALAAVEWVLYRSKPNVNASRLRGMGSPLDVRASALAELVKKQELEQLTEHPILDLLETPVPGSDSAPALRGPEWWELLSTWMDLVGEAPIGLGGKRNAAGERIGKPGELFPILPSWISSVPTPEKPFFEVVGPLRLKVPPKDLVWVRHIDPANPYTGRGVGTAAAVSDELETDEYMSTAARSRFFNNGMPAFMLGIIPQPNKAPPDGKQLAALTLDIENKHKGPDRAGGFHILGGDFKLQELGHTFAQSQYIDGRRFLRDMCMQIFGVPPEILGVLESSNKSTISAAREHFAAMSTVPMAERFRAALQATVVREFGKDLVLDYVSPIPDDEEAERKLMIALPGAFTINEVRARAGESPRTDGDVLMKPPGAPKIPIEGDAPKDVALDEETEEEEPEPETPAAKEEDDVVPDT